jgi:hypothetical protein
MVYLEAFGYLKFQEVKGVNVVNNGLSVPFLLYAIEYDGE